MFSSNDQDTLLELAKTALRDAIVENYTDSKCCDSVALSQPLGAFVSLYKHGELRGCIGRIISDIPLYKLIQEMSISAGLHDRRFSPVTEDELNELTFEITVLSPLYPVKTLSDITLGRHGLYLINGRHSSVFLPQVPVSQGWNLITYLRELSIKAGLHPDEWRRSQLFIFEGILIK